MPWFPVASGGGTNSVVNGANKQGSTIQAGQVCAIHSSGVGFVYANASNASVLAIGLLQALTISLGAGAVQTNGTMQLADWTNITGTTTLQAKGQYFLDVTNGKLTTTPPTTVGNIVQSVAEAVASDTLLIKISDPIQL